ncbi:MAG: hypothetical protein QXU32_00645 [Nitrososphaerales archaeon]
MPDPRISARTGGTVALEVTFYRNGVPTDPYAIRRIDIYEGSEKPENLVAQVPIPYPGSTDYPYPLVRTLDSSGDPLPGVFTLLFDIPPDFNAPSAYVDVWRFIGSDPGVTGSDTDLDNEAFWLSQCNRFWVFKDSFYVDDGLIVPRIGFEALDKVFRKPEIRTLEVGLIPLPLYDYDYNRIAPIIPQLKAAITIETENNEILIDKAPCKIGIRQGSYRTNPFTVQYKLDTSNFLVGTYVYRIVLQLPNGETRVSESMRFTIH